MVLNMKLRGKILRGRLRSRWEQQVRKDVMQMDGRIWEEIEKRCWEDRYRGCVVTLCHYFGLSFLRSFPVRNFMYMELWTLLGSAWASSHAHVQMEAY
jgi:hypothetical protein